jgi:hypothetical protein
MFPGGYFPKGYFPGEMFPPLDDTASTPTIPPRAGRRGPIVPAFDHEQDDEETLAAWVVARLFHPGGS